MAEEHFAAASIDAFFLRCGLTSQDQFNCYDFIKKLHSGRSILPSSCQGYCSLTMFVGHDFVVQFRPHAYRLDLRTTEVAREVYGMLAPETVYLGTIPSSDLMAYGMRRMDGISYKDLRNSGQFLKQSTLYRATLCKDLALFLSKSWYSKKAQCLPLGRIGKSIRARLTALSSDLPLRFRPVAQTLLRKLDRIECLPWVLTHGDFLPGNIMVNPLTGNLTGFVDWAEAERLPFGICLYGLEEVMGDMTPDGFQFHSDADALRCLFWSELSKEIPALQEDATLQSVKLARDLGVLLWHGIAFDNGAMNRVVIEGRDIPEIDRLDAFLDIPQLYSDPSTRI